MNLKISLILLTIVSVVADTMLLPFYSQFFTEVFGMSSSQHVGFYIAACSFTVMFTFPLWAKIAEKINELHLWVYTQIAAGCLGVACFFITDLVWFWIISQTMLVFKASYLLIYPFVMRLEEKDKHLGMVGLFSVLMHFGAIGGALLGGFVLQFFNPQDVYLIMAGSDALQVLVCLYIINKLNVPLKAQQQVEKSNTSVKRSIDFVYKLGFISALAYFSIFITMPFFSRYWETISQFNGELMSGFVYSIPGWIALGGLYLNHIGKRESDNFKAICGAMMLGVAGLVLQASEIPTVVIIGRCILGWGMFQATVRLEVLLFELSEPSAYAHDFSKIHFFQNLGVIASSFAAGALVTNSHFQFPFYVALVGFTITMVLFYFMFKTRLGEHQAATELSTEQ